MDELQQQIKMERQHQFEMSRQVDVGKKTIHALQDEIGVLKTRGGEVVARVRELEATVARLREDSESAHQIMTALRDELVEKDSLLQAARMSLEESEKQIQQQMSQVDFFYTMVFNIIVACWIDVFLLSLLNCFVVFASVCPSICWLDY